MCLPLAAQTPAFDDLTMVDDEIAETYRSAGKNHVFLRSKRGAGGLNKTSAADSIKTFAIKEIVLVFTEVNESAFDEREDANRERWENLLKTYPELFQSGTTYKSLCQCKIGGDSIAFKKAQGFYIYFTPKGAETKAAVKAEEKPAEVKASPAEEKSKVGKTSKVEENPAKTEKEAAKAGKTKTKEAEKEKEKAEKVVVEENKASPNNETQESGNSQEEAVKNVPQRKAPVGKARRAKDPKACRPACYENGDDDLNNFFKTTLVFSKKERRHIKKLSPIVKIQLNVDGSLKKVQVTGEDELLNKKVEGAINMMNKWNAAVKNGLTVKSEVKITLKYDKESKGLKPFEVVMNPRPGPKCKCASDSEIFGSD
jgi:hypothetical protein